MLFSLCLKVNPDDIFSSMETGFGSNTLNLVKKCSTENDTKLNKYSEKAIK